MTIDKVPKNRPVILDGQELDMDGIHLLIKNANVNSVAETLTRLDCKNLVKNYYRYQDYRISLTNQLFQVNRWNEEHPDDEPKSTRAIEELIVTTSAFEERAGNLLTAWCNLKNNRLAKWFLSVDGIGAIITAGLISNIDIQQSSTVGAILRYFGQDPTLRWVSDEDEIKKLLNEVLALYDTKIINHEILEQVCARLNRSALQSTNFLINQKHYSPEDLNKIDRKHCISSLKLPPYNQRMKTLCWKIGESFNKRSADKNIYRKIMDDRKIYENIRNSRGDYADQARLAMSSKNITNSDHKKIYESGMLPPGHIHSRCKRYAVKIFLSHVHAIMYWEHFRELPPAPFAIGILGHSDIIKIPNPEVIDFPAEDYYDMCRRAPRTYNPIP